MDIGHTFHIHYMYTLHTQTFYIYIHRTHTQKHNIYYIYIIYYIRKSRKIYYVNCIHVKTCILIYEYTHIIDIHTHANADANTKENIYSDTWMGT